MRSFMENWEWGYLVLVPKPGTPKGRFASIILNHDQTTMTHDGKGPHFSSETYNGIQIRHDYYQTLTSGRVPPFAGEQRHTLNARKPGS
ncbi:hypothetical protein TNCV_4134211 [Trichonephila clavipes]|nr:hypothetical protein TNCV_4134211 [Trichonephila clavipes]